MRAVCIGRNWLAALLLAIGLFGGGAVVARVGAAPANGAAVLAAISSTQGTPDATDTAEDEDCEDEENGESEDDATAEGTAEAEDNGDDEAAEDDEDDEDATAEADEENGDDDDGDAEATVAPGTLDDGADLLSQATITVEEAVAAAQGAAQGDLGEVDLEMENDTLIFSVDIGDQDVKIDATTGAVVAVEPEEEDEEGCAEEAETPVASGTLDDGAELLPQATITIEEAIAAAQGAAEGEVGEVDLEMEDGTLVFNVDIGDNDVKVDAATGQVLSVDQDD